MSRVRVIYSFHLLTNVRAYLFIHLLTYTKDNVNMHKVLRGPLVNKPLEPR